MVRYRKLIFIGIGICSTIIAGCATRSYSQSTISDRPAVTWTKDSATESEKKAAKGQVIGELKDPESARFGDIWALKSSNGKRVVCGNVNAKNSFGGYTGNKVFMLSSNSLMFEGSGNLGFMLPFLCTPRSVR